MASVKGIVMVTFLKASSRFSSVSLFLVNADFSRRLKGIILTWSISSRTLLVGLKE